MDQEAITQAIDAIREELDKLETELVGEEQGEGDEGPGGEHGGMGGGGMMGGKMPMPMPGE